MLLAELGRLADSSKTAAGVNDTWRGLARTLSSHAAGLKRSAQFRQLLAAKDDAFVAAFKELGKAKQAYEEVIQRFPDHTFGKEAKVMIDNLQYTDAELIERFRKQNEQADAQAAGR